MKNDDGNGLAQHTCDFIAKALSQQTAHYLIEGKSSL